MSKKYVFIAVVLILVLGLIIINQGRRAKVEEKVEELDKILQEVEQKEMQSNQAINELGAIDESEDELELDSRRTTGNTIDTSDLDVMLSLVDQTEKNANKAISDFDSIKESEDELNY